MAQVRVVLEDGTSIEKMGLLDWLVDNLWYIFLITNGHRRAQLMVDGTTLGIVVLDAIRKQPEQVIGSQPVGSTFPWPLPKFLPPSFYLSWVTILTSLSDREQCGTLSWNKPFPHQVAFGHDVWQSNAGQLDFFVCLFDQYHDLKVRHQVPRMWCLCGLFKAIYQR